ncbi:MAG: FHA domain-containing protein [Acidimicrobiales bacterium]
MNRSPCGRISAWFRFTVVDLGSTNGTRVNGVRVDTQVLEDGDELTFGNTRMRFEAS